MEVSQADKVIEILEKELKGIKKQLKTLIDNDMPQKIEALVTSLNNLSQVLLATHGQSPTANKGDEKKEEVQTTTTA